MAEKSAAQKLLVKAGYKILLVNPPEDYTALLGELPPDVSFMERPVEPANLILLFARNRQELEAHLPGLQAALAPGGLLWVAYYKGSSRLKTDIHRDTIVAYAQTLGLQGVAMVAMDADWAGLRLKVA